MCINKASCVSESVPYTLHAVDPIWKVHFQMDDKHGRIGIDPGLGLSGSNTPLI